MRQRRRAGTTALAGLVALSTAAAALTGCGPDSDTTSERETVTMGIMPWIGYAPWYIADRKGFFTELGIDVEFVNFQQDTERNTALFGGKTDVTNLDAGHIIQFAEKRRPVTPILYEDASVGADAILAAKSIRRAEQLRGRRVAYERGTTSDLLLHHYLLKSGIPFGDIRSDDVLAADAGALIAEGKTRVAVTYEPYITEATGGGRARDVHVLYDSAESPGLISDFLVANAGWLKGHQKEAGKLVAAWNKAIAFYRSDRTEAVEIMAEAAGTKPEDLTSTLRGVRLYSGAENKKLIASGELSRIYRSIAQTMTAMGAVTHPADLSRVADFRAVTGRG
ncbi:ABC transporter substrate-binding protein [Streptomyces sp. B1866]|uniref:ABC transporter substrate-binding protein n=1 Tax=Streptomyces sp. B1866 TaxID=3075431 RepID=UPI00288D13C3|nr:ABC transporter substrate-binding protein [Streptomyces sp. B1866]MDT3396897.1 ABC transporter substrate-binding protein [Streptomyces sp. B1866]